MTKKYDVIIIGGGIVGLSAGIYCGRLNLKTAIFSSYFLGTLVKTHIVENYPGFKSISGVDLTKSVFEHAKEYQENVDFIEKEIVEIKKHGNCFKVLTKKQEFIAKKILIATGSEWRKLNVSGEAEFLNKGVHYCAMCDAPFYKNKVVAVIGGGDSAGKEALLLSKFAKKVYMIIRSKLKAEPVTAEEIKRNKKIQVLEGVNIKEIKGAEKVNSVLLTKGELKVDGVFVDIGHIPNSQFAKKLGVKLNKKSEIIINKYSETNVNGIYAAGDVADAKFKQAITGVGEGVKAVYSIYESLGKRDVECV